jgi:hypothetical protein
MTLLWIMCYIPWHRNSSNKLENCRYSTNLQKGWQVKSIKLQTRFFHNHLQWDIQSCQRFLMSRSEQKEYEGETHSHKLKTVWWFLRIRQNKIDGVRCHFHQLSAMYGGHFYWRRIGVSPTKNTDFHTSPTSLISPVSLECPFLIGPSVFSI